MRFQTSQTKFGFGLVEVLIVVAISVIVFGGLFASVQYTLRLIANSSAKLSALSLANDRLEYFRSLPYDDVGTVAGIPPGLIPQNSTTTLNNIEFSERVLVEYVDDVADGATTATTTDSNGIPSDYKRIKIEISWSLHNLTDSISLVSNIVPRSIESTIGGGTVRVNVLDANATFLSGAEVRLLNETTTSTIDVTRFSDVSGSALFSGAPAASNYQVFVTAPGYSTDQTYISTTTNPYPITAPFSVLESDISTVTFQIGELSDIEVTTLSDVTEGSLIEPFDDMSGIANNTDTDVTSGELVLAGGPGSYVATGQAFLAWVNPPTLEKWEKVVLVGSIPGGTDFNVKFYTGTSSSYTLVNDSDLPGNATGFSQKIIDISSLDVTTYPNLTVAITLETGSAANTPAFDEVSTYYRVTETTRSTVGLTIRGNKTIGTALDASPIYKTDLIATTDGSGEVTLDDIEFDIYTIENTDGFTLARACSNVPLLHQAGITSIVELVLVPSVTNSLRVTVTANDGTPLPGAVVELSRPSFNDTVVTDACGQAFFSSGVSASADYDIDVTRTGYSPVSVTSYSISGASETSVVMSEL